MAENIKYNYKLYSLDGQTSKALSPKLITDSPVFSNSIDSWPDGITLKIPKTFDNTEFDWFDIIEIAEFSEENKTGRLLFAGSIESMPWQLNSTENTTWLECKWLHQLLSTIIYQSWWTRSFNKNDTLENVLTDIVDYFNSLQQRAPWVWYNGLIWSELIKIWTIEAKSININFDNNTCLEAIVKSTETAWLKFYISADWTINAFEKPSTPTHRFKLKIDAQSLNIKRKNKYELVNKLYLERNGGTVKTYEDATSQSVNWLREKYLSKTDINSEASQDQFWDQYILDNKDPLREITVVINNKYDLSSINPWDTISILNSNETIQNVMILKTSYDWYFMTLNLEKYRSLWKILVTGNAKI